MAAADFDEMRRGCWDIHARIDDMDLAGIGASDSDAVVRAQIQAFARYYNLHLETYGREIVIEEFQGTGDPQNDQVLRSDAVAIAQNLEPFAVFHHNVAIGGAFTEELGARGVICHDNPHRSLHQPHALSWPPLPTIAFHKRSVSAWSSVAI